MAQKASPVSEKAERVSGTMQAQMLLSTPIKRLIALNTSECLWIYVLRVISEKPMHAYALRKIIEERFGFTPGLVTAYKVLYLLESEGYVKTEDAGRITNYAITPRGKKLLSDAANFYKKQARMIEI